MTFAKRHKRLLALLAVLLLATTAWAVDTKLSALTAMPGGATGDDLLYVVDDPNGTPTSYKVGRDELLLSWTGSANLTTLATGAVDVAELATATKAVGINLVLDGGGSEIAAGTQIWVEVPYAFTITSVRLGADQSGSIAVDIWKDTYANFPPTAADSITAAAVPTITTATKSEDTTLTGWTTAVSAGDWLKINVDSCATITRCTLSIRGTRS
jgi:hypothetical protein